MGSSRARDKPEARQVFKKAWGIPDRPIFLSSQDFTLDKASTENLEKLINSEPKAQQTRLLGKVPPKVFHPYFFENERSIDTLKLILERGTGKPIVQAAEMLESKGYSPSCEGTVELDSEGGSMEGVPVNDQDGLGICYAETAAKLADALINSTKPPSERTFRTSAIDAALSSPGLDLDLGTPPTLLKSSADSMESFEGGIGLWAFKALLEKGACSNQHVETRLQKIFFKNLNDQREIFAKVYRVFDEQYLKIYEQGKEGADFAWIYAPTFTKTALTQAATQVQANLSCVEGSASADLVAIPDLSALEADLQDKNHNSFLASVMFPACSTNRTLLPPGTYATAIIDVLRGRSRQAWKLLVLHHFAKGKTAFPLGIGYCGKLLTKGRGFVLGKDECGGHASILTGKRVKNGKCQFKIMNSWGAGCAVYSKDWDCENGSVWVDADRLIDTLSEVDVVGIEK